jgi:hypothetical protein
VFAVVELDVLWLPEASAVVYLAGCELEVVVIVVVAAEVAATDSEEGLVLVPGLLEFGSVVAVTGSSVAVASVVAVVVSEETQIGLMN